MILEAFAKYLHDTDQSLSSTEVLARWLWETLSVPPKTAVDQVIHCEIIICREPASKSRTTSCELAIPSSEQELENGNSAYVFKGTSKSGIRLLNSLKEYCLSYDQQKWARWVHNIKASDFTTSDIGSTDEKSD